MALVFDTLLRKSALPEIPVERLFSEATMGIEPMVRVLQFCTVGLANENYFQTAVSLVLNNVPVPRHHAKTPRNPAKTACRQEQEAVSKVAD